MVDNQLLVKTCFISLRDLKISFFHPPLMFRQACLKTTTTKFASVLILRLCAGEKEEEELQVDETEF